MTKKARRTGSFFPLLILVVPYSRFLCGDSLRGQSPKLDRSPDVNNTERIAIVLLQKMIQVNDCFAKEMSKSVGRLRVGNQI